MSEAFTYCWIDKKIGKIYVGYHKGDQNDGYVCSSKWMLEEYKKRPEDFTRMILVEGTAEYCHALESSILQTLDAMNRDYFYNQSNGNGTWINKHCSDHHRKLLSEKFKGKKMGGALKDQRGKNNPMYGKIPWNKGKKGVPPETSQKMSQKSKGRTPWNKGIKCPDYMVKNISVAVKKQFDSGRETWNKGKTMDEKHRNSMSKAQKLLVESPDYIHPMKGKHHKESSKELIRQKALGRKRQRK